MIGRIETMLDEPASVTAHIITGFVLAFIAAWGAGG